jgi:hypothetical protein
MSLIHSILGRIARNRQGRDFDIASAPFYRKRPFGGQVRLKSADRRGVVDFDFGFFYNRVPKAANTTIMSNLAKWKNGGLPPAATDLRSLFPLTPAQLTEEQVERFGQLFKFTFVRNPYARVLSAYLDKIAKDGEPARRRKMRRTSSDGVPSFEDFVRWLDRDGLHEDMHWAPQSSILVIPVEEFDFIGKVEKLNGDFLKVAKRLGRVRDPNENEVQTFAPHSTGADDKMSGYYNAELKGVVARLYREDFERFGYDT